MWAAVGLVTAAGLALRLWNLGAGLPDLPQPDEPTIVGLAVSFRHGDLNPHFFGYPTLWPYAIFAAFGGFFLVGKVLGVFASVAEFQTRYVVDPSPFFLLGRFLSAALGTATIPITYRLGADLLASPRAGLLAAVLLAIAPLHVEYSHYLVTDAPLTFAVAGSFLLLLRFVAGAPRAQPWRVGLAVGLATSLKYPAVAMALPLLLGVAVRLPRPLPLGRTLSALTGAAAWVLAGFLAATPYAVLDAPAFATGVRTVFGHAWSGHLGFPADVNGFVSYLTETMPAGSGLAVTILAIAGFALTTCVAAVRRQTTPLLAACFVLAYFASIGSSRTPFARYLVPLVPFVALYAAQAVDGIARRVGAGATGWTVAAALVVGMVAGPLASSVRWVAELACPDTRALARAWIERHFPSGSIIVTDPYGPPLKLSLEQLAAEIRAVHATGDTRRAGFRLEPSEEKYEILSRLPVTGPSFVVYTLAGGRPRTAETGQVPYSLEAVRATGARYVVVSSYMYERFRRNPAAYPVETGFYEDLDRGGRLVFGLSPVERIRSGSLDVLESIAISVPRCPRYNGPALMIFELG